ncbi:hypothetical protein AAHA92_11705 [Salvia divinorum]|uniref:Protein kinase domain-containing protein n=1 Tax=Salvia divinorum TaxID=28513 RepID=A0ABD1HIB2_SALDI
MYLLGAPQLALKRSISIAVRIVVVLCVYWGLFTELWCHVLKEGKYRNFSMEPLKNHNTMQYSSERGNEDHGPVSLVHRTGASGYENPVLQYQENDLSEPKPVRNFSIQTGEEFALEFMRDRVNPKIPFIPNEYGDSSYVPGYLDLKGILGISHTGSESGSDIPMVASMVKASTEVEQRNMSLHGSRVNHGSVQVRRVSSDYNNQPMLMHSSSGASDSSSQKLKALCSFGGKILPRPSDGKLRYVGGETRIIRIIKDITWRELWLKTTAIYDETHSIKYQLPGEDLDALVSVSSDEDLLNMMEECNLLNGIEESRKLRMFLFSLEDLEDAHFSLANTDGDFEIKYVVAVNSMDVVSRKSSNFRGLASSSGNSLNKLDTLNVERDTSRASSEFVGINTSDVAGFIVPSTVGQSSKYILPNSSNVYENAHFNHGQIVHHHEDKHQPPQFDYNLHPSYNAPSESAVHQSSYGAASQHKGLEGKPPGYSDAQGTQVLENEAKLKVDGSVQPESKSNGNRELNFPVEESTVVIPKLGKELSSKKTEGRAAESVPAPKPFDVVKTSQISSGNEHCASGNAQAPEPVNSECDATDLGHPESSISPQRVYNSERIPREEGGPLNRISKSDDSWNSQFLVNQSHADSAQQDLQDLVSGFTENLQNGNVDIPAEQSIPTYPVEPETFDNGHQRTQMVDAHDVKESLHENQDLIGVVEAGLKLPTESHEDSTKHSEDPTARWVDGVGCQAIPDDAHDHSQLARMAGTHGESKAALPRTEQGDILIDINDRFPRNLLSDIFSQAILSDNSSDISPVPKDGAGLSMNMENHEPKRWSFFQRLAGDEFLRRDVSLIDQDHVIHSSAITKVEEHAPLAYDFVPLTREGTLPSHPEFQENYGDRDQKNVPAGDQPHSMDLRSNFDAPQAKVNEGVQYSDLPDNMKIPDSDYESGIGSIGLPPLEPSLEDFDINSLQIIQDADLEELRELGSGTFGTVYHGKWRGSDVAIKRIKKSCFTGRQSEQERLTNEFWREADILSKLHHPNVVAFYGVVQDGPGGTLATVAEFMVDGSLRHVLLRKDRHLDRRKRLIIAMDAAFGMEYLHSKNIVHFDLKCDNLLVNLKDPSRPICKVGDFGLSKIKRNTLVSGGVRGTLPWMAPELLNGSSSKVSEKVDVFSFGIVLWEILTGEEPYANMHYGAIIGGIVNNTLRPTIPSYCDSEWRQLMEQCWAPNPVMRPSFTEIASRLRVMSAAAQPQPRKAAAS